MGAWFVARDCPGRAGFSSPAAPELPPAWPLGSRWGMMLANALAMLADPEQDLSTMPTYSSEIAHRLDALAGRRGPGAARTARGRDALLRLADQAPAPTPEEAARLLHGVLSAVKRRAISERFAGKLLDKTLPAQVAAKSRPTVAIDLPLSSTPPRSRPRRLRCCAPSRRESWRRWRPRWSVRCWYVPGPPGSRPNGTASRARWRDRGLPSMERLPTATTLLAPIAPPFR